MKSHASAWAPSIFRFSYQRSSILKIMTPPALFPTRFLLTKPLVYPATLEQTPNITQRTTAPRHGEEKNNALEQP